MFLSCHWVIRLQVMLLWHTGILPLCPQQALSAAVTHPTERAQSPNRTVQSHFHLNFAIFIDSSASAWGCWKGDAQETPVPALSSCQAQEQEHPLPTAQPGVPSTAPALGKGPGQSWPSPNTDPMKSQATHLLSQL